MKKLFGVLGLLIVCIAAVAQNTNLPSVFTPGSGGGGGSSVPALAGSRLLLTGAASSNAIFYVASNRVVTTTTDTNSIWLAGGGDSGLNGQYRFKTGAPIRHFTNGTYHVVYDTSGEVHLFLEGYITNNAGSLRYSSDDPGVWVAENGTAPPPTVTDGTNFHTNFFYEVTTSLPVAMRQVNTNVLHVDPSFGDDVEGLPGRPDRPYRTVTGAVAASRSNNVIVLSPGHHAVTNTTLTLPAGVSLQGAGIGRSFMTTTNVGNVNLACSGNNTVSDMSCMFVVGINGGKNIYVNNVWLEGRTNIDCFLASGAFSNVVFNSCIMRSTYDVGVVAGQSTNNTLTLLNCDAQTLVPPGTTNAARAFPVGGGLFRVYGGSIRTLQGHETGGFHAFCVGTESGVTAGTAAIELSGVTLIAQSTNATAYTIYNASSVPISARGMLLKRSTTSGPFSAEGDFVDGLQSTNLVLFASTNMIKFAGTNTAPATPGTINKWISVQVEGESAAYRIPLYQ